MYSVLDYGRMAMDAVRMDAYARAIARAVRPGDVVVDIGAGTGILSLLALRAGASHVHAIEPNPAITLLPDIARENGFADRVTVHRCPSFEVTLPKPADVMVSDLRGSFPLFEDHLRIIGDARARLLRAGGAMIPERDRLYVAFVESEENWRKIRAGWESFEKRGFSAAAARASVLNNAYSDGAAPLAATALLSEPVSWLDLDYRSVDSDFFEATVEPKLARGGTAHGVAAWFDATVLGDIGYSNAPGASLVYSRVLLPLLEPIRVEAGDRSRITLRVDARATRWAWDTEIVGKQSFRQSTFFGLPIDAASLLRESTTHCPTRSARGERMMKLLAAMDGSTTVRDLSTRVADTLAPDSPLRAGIQEEVRDAVSRYGV
jgi:type I protein arginine methyltransferase